MAEESRPPLRKAPTLVSGSWRVTAAWIEAARADGPAGATERAGLGGGQYLSRRSPEVEIATRRVKSRLQLVVRDNGHGLPAGTEHCPHLSQRAKVLKGDLDLSSRSGKGTCVTLTLRN